jgi:Serine hydrolase (FSH1)
MFFFLPLALIMMPWQLHAEREHHEQTCGYPPVLYTIPSHPRMRMFPLARRPAQVPIQGRRIRYACFPFACTVPVRRALVVFIDAPMVLQPVDIPSTLQSAAEQDRTLDAPGADDPAATPRAWWRSNAARTHLIGLEESLAYIRDVLARDHFQVRA